MSISKRWMLLGAAATLVALSFVGSSEPARAQFGVSIGGLPFQFHIGPGYRRPGARRSRGPREESQREDPGPRKGKDEKVVVSAGAPTVAEQTIALRRVATVAASADVGSAKDLKEVGKPVLNERDRDYTARIKGIIKRFIEEQDRDSTPGDVTAAAIEQSLDRSFKNAKLDIFERFKTESWTSERLRVMILDRTENQIGALFKGNNKGNAPMAQLDSIIQSGAEEVYTRIFETSELLAANKSSSLFMQRLYQTHGALVTDELRESADYIITKASLTALAPFERALQRDDKIGYTYRYRGQRVIFDCLSENVDGITAGDAKIANIDEIRKRILKTSNTVCARWLVNQFGSEKDTIKAQRPVAMRAVWSEEGPMSAL